VKQTLFYYDLVESDLGRVRHKKILIAKGRVVDIDQSNRQNDKSCQNNVSKHTKSAVCKLQYFHRQPARQVLQLKITG